MVRHSVKKKQYSPDYMHGYVDGLKHAEEVVWQTLTDKEMERLDETNATHRLMKALEKVADNASAGKGYRERV